MKPDQELLVQILSKANDLLTIMNKEMFNTEAAKKIFNMLMAAAINLKIAQFN